MAFTDCFSLGPKSSSRRKVPLGSVPPGPLPTSSSAILGPAVLVQLLGVLIIVLLSHRLLTFCILDSRKERRQMSCGDQLALSLTVLSAPTRLLVHAGQQETQMGR